ncbi:MAG: protein-S-isoprenylcysteine O-methyltransferase [Planctomycetota bacterium]
MFNVDNIFEVIFLAGFIVGSVIRKVYTFRARGNKTANKRKSVLDIVLINAGGVGLAAPLFYLFTSWLDFADYDLPGLLGWVGTAVFAGALLLLWRSHADLGRNWSATLKVREGHTLVTAGVYRYLRHPMYAAHWLWAIAQALLIENWLAGLALLVTFLPLCLIRIPREEQMMLENFGEQYRQYMNRTGRLIPRLWR